MRSSRSVVTRLQFAGQETRHSHPRPTFLKKTIAMAFSIGEVTRWLPIERAIRFVGSRVPIL